MKKIFKIISIFLALILICQDVGWASPNPSYSNNTLQQKSELSGLQGEFARECAGRTPLTAGDERAIKGALVGVSSEVSEAVREIFEDALDKPFEDKPSSEEEPGKRFSFQTKEPTRVYNHRDHKFANRYIDEDNPNPPAERGRTRTKRLLNILGSLVIGAMVLMSPVISSAKTRAPSSPPDTMEELLDTRNIMPEEKLRVAQKIFADTEPEIYQKYSFVPVKLDPNYIRGAANTNAGQMGISPNINVSVPWLEGRIGKKEPKTALYLAMVLRHEIQHMIDAGRVTNIFKWWYVKHKIILFGGEERAFNAEQELLQKYDEKYNLGIDYSLYQKYDLLIDTQYHIKDFMWKIFLILGDLSILWFIYRGIRCAILWKIRKKIANREKLVNRRRRSGDGYIWQGEESIKEFESKRSGIEQNDITNKYKDRLIRLLNDVIARSPDVHRGDEAIPSGLQGSFSSLAETLRQENFKIYGFTSIVKGRDDFFLGKYDKNDNKLYLAEDLISELEARGPSNLVDEYLLHEVLCAALGHYKAMEAQRIIFGKHYKPKNWQEYNEAVIKDKGILKYRLRGFIDKRNIPVLRGEALERTDNDEKFTIDDYGPIAKNEVLFDRIHELRIRMWMVYEEVKSNPTARKLVKNIYKGLVAGYMEDKEYHEGRVQDDLIELQELVNPDTNKWDRIESLIIDIKDRYVLREVRDIDRELEFLEIIGFGRNAVIKKVRREEDVYALKCSSAISRQTDPMILNEYRVLEDLKDVKNVPRMYGQYRCRAILMELIEGKNLREAGSQNKEFFAELEKIAWAIFKKGYTVEDLRDENIMVKADGAPVIVDFAAYEKYSVDKKERYKKELQDRLAELRRAYLKEGLCVTGDTVLPLLVARYSLLVSAPTKIVDVKSGDYVLSLNEETQRIEPHRINGLLDMGTKPVYRLTTASGRSIKTTANHPYLTRNGWVKVSGLREGDEIGVPNAKEIYTKEKLETQTDFFKCNFSKSFSITKTFNCFKDFNTRKSAFAIIICRNPFRKVFGSYICLLKTNIKGIYFWIISNPHISSLFKIISINSYYNNLGIFFNKYRSYLFSFIELIIPIHIVCKIFSAFKPAQFSFFPIGTSDSIFNFFFSSPSIEKLLFGMPAQTNRLCSFQHTFDNNSLIDKLSRLFTGIEVWAAEIDAGTMQDSRILWDKIVSIEYIGNEHVYDIEVEGTHNFIGNGIFAHNTYMRSSDIPENIGKDVDFIVSDGNLTIKKIGIEEVLAENLSLEPASVDLVRIKEIARGLNVYKEFGDEFIRMFDAIKIMVFTGTTKSRSAGAFAHMGKGGVLYIDNVLLNNDMAIIHEVIHEYLKRVSEIELMHRIGGTGVGKKIIIKDSSKSESYRAFLRHYYARYYLQNPIRGKYEGSQNEQLTKEIRIASFMNLFIDSIRNGNLDTWDKIDIGKGRILTYTDDLLKVPADSSEIMGTAGCYGCVPIIVRTNTEGNGFNYLVHNKYAEIEDNERKIDEFIGYIGKQDCVFVFLFDIRLLNLYRKLSEYILAKYPNSKVLLVPVCAGKVKTAIVMREGVGICAGNLDQKKISIPEEGASQSVFMTWERLYAMFGKERSIFVRFENLNAINKISSEFGIDPAILVKLFDKCEDDDGSKGMSYILLKLLKEDGEITEDEIKVLIVNIKRVMAVVDEIEGLVREEKKEVIKRVALYLSIEHIRRSNLQKEVPDCVEALVEALHANSNFREKALKTVSDLRKKDIRVADVFLNKIADAFGEKIQPHIDKVRQYLYLRMQVAERLKADPIRVSPIGNIADIVNRYLRNREEAEKLVEIMTRYLLGEKFGEDIVPSLERVKTIKQILGGIDFSPSNSLPISSFRERIGKITAGSNDTIILQHVSIYLSGNPDWDRENMDSMTVNLINNLAREKKIMFIYDTVDEKGRFIELLKSKGIKPETVICGKYEDIRTEIQGKRVVKVIKEEDERFKDENTIVTGKDKVVDLYLMWNVTLLYAQYGRGEEFSKNIKSFFRKYYENSEFRDKIGNLIEEMFSKGIWIILPPVIPFINDYFEVLNNARELINQSA